MQALLIAFIIIPIIEIAIFIEAGQWLGLPSTLALIVVTAVVGVMLLRQQGLSTLLKAQERMNLGQIPAMEMLEGILLAIAGALLITPGFFTDAVGFSLLIPLVRHYLIKKHLMSRFEIHQSHIHSQTFEGEIIVEQEENNDNKLN